MSTPRIVLLGEPAGLDEWLARWSGALDLRGGQWTDAFDADFRRYTGVVFLHLMV